MMIKFFKLTVIISTLLFFPAFNSIADEVIGQQKVFKSIDNPPSQDQEVQVALDVSGKVLALVALSEHDKAAAQVKLLNLQDSGFSFNYAEQYLLNITRANISDIDGQENKVINWLNKAIKLEPLLAKKQLDSPLFAGAYLTLANIYARMGEDKQAFDNKKKYIKKYFAHLSEQKALRVNRLNEKYNIEKKHEENELLTQNNEIKQYALASAETTRIQQYRNIAIFIVLGIIFLLLLIRQFKIRRALKILAKTDNLTRLANRRSFFTSGYSFMTQALKQDKELSVLMLDIDNFKAINDQFGHDVGDNVICHVSALASDSMRSRDVLARIGGEEFAAILPDANIEQARAIAEHIREKIQGSAFTNQDNSIEISVSIGIATIREVNESFDGLLHAADMAMYKAKKNGRNRVSSNSVESEEKQN